MGIGNFKEEEGVGYRRSISMWSGSISGIPEGWVLCDGNNGTPDLRGKFVKGVPNGSTNPGGVGGANSQTLSTGQLPSHNHSASVGTTGSHNHDLAVYHDSNSYSGGNTEMAPDEDDHNKEARTSTTNSGGSHSHNLSIGKTGSGNSIDNKPSYYEVAYIMQL